MWTIGMKEKWERKRKKKRIDLQIKYTRCKCECELWCGCFSATPYVNTFRMGCPHKCTIIATSISFLFSLSICLLHFWSEKLIWLLFPIATLINSILLPFLSLPLALVSFFFFHFSSLFSLLLSSRFNWSHFTFIFFFFPLSLFLYFFFFTL